jgi:hypothetical protein
MADRTGDATRYINECTSECTGPALNKGIDMTSIWSRSIIVCCALLVFPGCMTIPNGPSVAVMPAQGKPFDMFVAEDRECRQFAKQSAGSDASSYTEYYELQRRYDIAYEQCMYAKGNQLPQSSAYPPRVNYSQPPMQSSAPVRSYDPPPPPGR